MRHSSSVACSLPQRRLSNTVPLNNTFFCSTTATSLRNTSKSYSFTFLPPTSTVPSDTSYKRLIKLTRLDLPLPVPPIMPIVSPEAMLKFSSFNTYFSAPLWYPKLTLSNTILPSSTSMIGCSGLTISAFSFKISAIRLPLAILMVVITKIIDNIIKDINTLIT